MHAFVIPLGDLIKQPRHVAIKEFSCLDRVVCWEDMLQCRVFLQTLMHRIQISPTLQYTASNKKEKKKDLSQDHRNCDRKIKVLVVGTGFGVRR